MSIRRSTSIAGLIRFSFGLLVVHSASAQNLFEELRPDLTFPSECNSPTLQLDDYWQTLKGAMEAIEAENDVELCEYVDFQSVRENIEDRLETTLTDRIFRISEGMIAMMMSPGYLVQSIDVEDGDWERFRQTGEILEESPTRVVIQVDETAETKSDLLKLIVTRSNETWRVSDVDWPELFTRIEQARESPAILVDSTVPETLRELVVQADYSRSDYRAHCRTPWRLHVRILDPLVVATLALERERRRSEFFWSPWCVDASWYSLPDYAPVVTIQISPNWGTPLWAYGASGALGGRGDLTGRPLTSFTQMELLRDDVVIRPISTQRARDGSLRGTDRDAYYGSIKYSPDAFTPGAEVILRVWREDNDQPNTMRLSQRLLNSISRNFELYSEAMSPQ